MKILIITCGVGIGHASRDLALAKILKTNGHDVEFASYGSGLHYLQKNNCNPHTIPEMNFEATEGGIDVEESLKQSKDIPFIFIKSMYKEAKLIRKIKPDLLITDSDYSSPITAKLLNIPCYILTNDLTFGFSDTSSLLFVKYFEKSVSKLINEISSGCQRILIPDIPNSVEIPEELKEKSNFIGPLLHQNISNIDSKNNLRKKYNIDINDKVILVTIGGSKFGKMLISNICDIACDINIDKIFIFTGLELELSTFKIPENTDKVIIKQFSNNLIEWMKLSDLTIALAGHTTTMELISIQKPNILIPLKNHAEQKRNIKQIMKYNITKTTQIDDKKKLLDTINNTIKNLDKITINKEEYNTFIQYDGKKNALKIIEKVNTKN